MMLKIRGLGVVIAPGTGRGPIAPSRDRAWRKEGWLRGYYNNVRYVAIGGVSA
jgi:hypothetical protein